MLRRATPDKVPISMPTSIVVVHERTSIWLIAGGESGYRHRSVSEPWLIDLRDRCRHAGVPFFFKQWGGRYPKSGGRLLAGREWSEMPTADTTRWMSLDSAREAGSVKGPSFTTELRLRKTTTRSNT